MDPDDSNEAGLKLPIQESAWVKLGALLAIVTLATYTILRIYDAAQAHKVRRVFLPCALLRVCSSLQLSRPVLHGVSSRERKWNGCVRGLLSVLQEEHDGARLFYRLLTIAIEFSFGVSACGATVSRTRRQRLEALRPVGRDAPFAVDDILTLLFVTDENAKAIVASADSHYGAAKPGAPPHNLVLLARKAHKSS